MWPGIQSKHMLCFFFSFSLNTGKNHNTSFVMERFLIQVPSLLLKTSIMQANQNEKKSVIPKPNKLGAWHLSAFWLAAVILVEGGGHVF